jgi:dsDNA-binding SOS-regulon protein
MNAKNMSMRRAIQLPILQKLDSIDRKLDKLDEIARTLNEIRDILGVSAQGEARESLILFLELEKGEIPLKIKEATRKTPRMPDVVVETETAVYLMEAKHTLNGPREAEKVVEQLSRGAVWYQKNGEKHGFTKKGPVIPVVFAWECSPTAREVLQRHGIRILSGRYPSRERDF